MSSLPSETTLLTAAAASDSPTLESSSTRHRNYNDVPTFTSASTTKRGRRPGSARSAVAPMSGSKIGPQRTSKVSQKLKILPSPADQDEESGRDVYSQVTRIKDSTARRDAERLGKAERAQLPRVTAFATANSYDLDALFRFLKARAPTRGTAPKKFDECVYTPFSYTHANNIAGVQEPQQHSDDLIDLHHQQQGNSEFSDPFTSQSSHQPAEEDEDDMGDERSLHNFVARQNQAIVSSDVFFFQYGVTVIWGMSVADERRLLRDISRFETEKLGDEDVQVENFNFYVTSSYQPRIYNDFIALRDGRNYMVKLSISHAIAQSVKISLFEDLVDNTIEDTKSIPTDIATSGKVNMNRRDIMKHIGELFILRININLQGSVLDSPELMWAEPQLEPVYMAARSYLEINQRLSLLNQRLDVIGDLLQMLKEQMSHSQGENLEWIVIILIAAEILVAVVNVVVDLMAAE